MTQHRALARVGEMAVEIGEQPDRCPHEFFTPFELYELRKAELEDAGLSAEEHESRLARLVEELGL